MMTEKISTQKTFLTRQVMGLSNFKVAPYQILFLRGDEMKVQELHDQLEKAEEGKRYLVLSRVFNTVFNRKLRRNEWGMLRKLENLYGAESVFWALIGSFHIDSSSTPLKYVASICRNTVKEDIVENESREIDNSELEKLLKYMEDYKQPNWEKILDASGETTQAEVGESDN